MSDERQEPEGPLGGELAHVAAYLEFYRSTLVEKCRSLPAAELRVARMPSGWTPLELLDHVAHMEQRWIVWGFLGEPVERPWEDSGDDPEGRWQVPAGTSADDVAAMLRSVGAVARGVLADVPLDTVAATGGRFDADPPPLAWICFHVLQEYARHVGHLDVVIELAGGPTGE